MIVNMHKILYVNLDRKYVHLVVILLLYGSKVLDASCEFDAQLQNGSWTYIYGSSTATLEFGSSTMTGLSYSAKGDQIKDYTCIQKSNEIHILKSDRTYTDAGNNRHLYICMRISKVSDDLYYLYFLSDIDTVATPNDRVYNPAHDQQPSDSDPCTTFCSYTDIPDSDVRTLERFGTSGSLPGGETVCACEQATCSSSSGGSGELSNGEKAAIGVGVTAVCAASIGGASAAVYKVYGKNKWIKSKISPEEGKENIAENKMPGTLVEDSANSVPMNNHQ